MKKKKRRIFKTGAIRNSTRGKFDYEGFVSPLVENSFGRYMHKNRKMEDGTYRDSDNWQQGMPSEELLKSFIRHSMDIHLLYRGYDVVDENGAIVTKEEALNGAKFNINALILDLLKDTKKIKRGE